MRARLAIGLLWPLLSSACSAPVAAPDPRVTAARDYVKEVTGDDLKVGGLSVTTTGVTTDGRHARIRGTVENRYDQPVAGIRYAVEIFYGGDDIHVLDTWRRQVDTTLDPGQRRHMSLDVASMYLSGSFFFRVIAQPVKLGGVDVPPPPGWK